MMAKSAKSSNPARAQRTKPVPVEQVMFSFRTINEQGLTKEFLGECAKAGFDLRLAPAFFEFTRKYAAAAAANPPQKKAVATTFTAAMKKKDWNNCTKK